MIDPFRIRIDEDQLEDLGERLRRVRWPQQIRDDWSEGTELEFLRCCVSQDSGPWPLQ